MDATFVLSSGKTIRIGYIVTVDIIESNGILAEFLVPGRSALSSRLGVVESTILDHFDSHSSAPSLSNRKLAWVNAGIFPPTSYQLRHFADLYRDAIKNTDIFAVWPTALQPAHDKLIQRYGSNKPQFDMGALDIFKCLASVQNEDTWVQKFYLKNVLIVHPFVKSFELQFSRIGSVHRFPVLPNFNPIFSAPPMTQGLKITSGTFENNLKKYIEDLEETLRSQPVDFALVAAGAYGLPISRFLKSRCVTTVYTGGSLQLFFGVLGGRWSKRKDLEKFRTSNWLETPLETPPRGALFIERKTYW